MAPFCAVTWDIGLLIGAFGPLHGTFGLLHGTLDRCTTLGHCMGHWAIAWDTWETYLCAVLPRGALHSSPTTCCSMVLAWAALDSASAARGSREGSDLQLMHGAHGRIASAQQLRAPGQGLTCIAIFPFSCAWAHCCMSACGGLGKNCIIRMFSPFYVRGRMGTWAWGHERKTGESAGA